MFSAAKNELGYMKEYISRGDEKRFIGSLVGNDKIKNYYNDATRVRDVISSNALVSDKKYPSIKNLETLYGRFGIERVIDKITAKSQRNFKVRITSFSDIRTAIAHEHPSPDLTFVDVKTNIGYIKDAVQYLDRVLYSHIVDKSGAECWRD